MLMKKDGKNNDHGMKKITKCGEEKGLEKTHLGFFMLVHGISRAYAFHNILHRQYFYSEKTKRKTQKG